MALTHTETQERIKNMTPDEALEILRSLVFSHEQTLFNNLDMSQETAESYTEEAHVALVALQRFVDQQESGYSEAEEDTLG
jgi:hypothetical protein